MRKLRELQSRLRRQERGYSLVELLTVMAILAVVLEALTTLFVAASRAESDMSNRFTAQQTARVALDKVRREVHCASGATPAGTSTSSITLTVPTYCQTYSGSTSVTWCTRGVSANRYALYRINGSTCTGGVKWADYLVPTSGASTCSGALCIFNYSPPSAANCTASCTLARLHVDVPVNARPSKTVDTYELADDLVLRNTVRS
jgi:prepilin-type N-terminal cleavage/methylation domain-containing protein